MFIVYDEEGKAFPSLKAACRAHSVSDDSYTYQQIRLHGKVKRNGVTFYLNDPTKGSKGAPVMEPSLEDTDKTVLDRLRAQYSPEELQALAEGRGFARHVDYPSISLTGTRHRLAVISDTHIGSRFSPYEWHDIVAEKVRELGCECVLHCGDLTEGMRIRRVGTQMYELSDLGFEAQRDRAVEAMSKYGIPIYAISGNHDAFFKEYAGADIVKAVADRVEGFEYLGYDTADIKVDGATIRLWHGGDGNSYALSYRLQKVIESMTGGTKPGILLAGHVHKFCYIFERNVHAISCPCMQMQTDWMRGKKLAAHTGFLVLDFEVHEGCISNLSVRLFPFYA